MFFCIFCLVCNFPKQIERRGDFSIKDGSDSDTQTRFVNCCTRTGAHIVISICVNEGYTLYHVALCLPCDKYCFFSILPSHSTTGSPATASLSPRRTPHPADTGPSRKTVRPTRYLGRGYLFETPRQCSHPHGRFLPGRPGVKLTAQQLGLPACPAERYLRFIDHDPQRFGGRRPLEGLPEIRPRSCAQGTISTFS